MAPLERLFPTPQRVLKRTAHVPRQFLPDSRGCPPGARNPPHRESPVRDALPDPLFPYHDGEGALTWVMSPATRRRPSAAAPLTAARSGPLPLLGETAADASRTIDFEETGTSRTRPQPFLPCGPIRRQGENEGNAAPQALTALWSVLPCSVMFCSVTVCSVLFCPVRFGSHELTPQHHNTIQLQPSGDQKMQSDAEGAAKSEQHRRRRRELEKATAPKAPEK
eukprot:gene23217-biopygen7269